MATAIEPQVFIAICVFGAFEPPRHLLGALREVNPISTAVFPRENV